MGRLEIIKKAFLTAVVLLTLQVLAVMFSLYLFYWWFDIPMHFIGGFLLGLFSVWTIFFARVSSAGLGSRFKVFLVAVLGAFLIGLIWEVFEYSFGLTWNAVDSYIFDTKKDLVMDMLGGVTAYLYFSISGYKKPAV